MSDKLDRFVNLMKGIFELDKSDLDFGIYRIMNIRKAEIEKFLFDKEYEHGLHKKITGILAPFAQSDTEDLKNKIESIEKQASAFGMDISTLPDDNQMKQQYNSLKAQLAGGTDLSALESDVYSALYNFFNRYYDEGDFISKRRYKEGVYAIPYEGEEVKLYWANQDQYYVKTSENFKDYTFKANDYLIHFRIVDATTEQNNNKESDDSKRVFMLFTEDEENFPGIKTFEHNAETSEIIIRFVYDIPEDKKRKYAEENYKAVHDFIYSNNSTIPVWQTLLAPVPTGKGKETTTLLEKHMKAYVAKNTFDYFIHKDLKGFLIRELDFYIKSEIMHLDDLDTTNEQRVETYLAKVRAVKRVGHIIIDFLSQIENFQKKLWLKKKFVIETNWCITLDHIDERFYPEIIANTAQIQEWIDMYAVDEIKGDMLTEGFTNPPTVEFLRQNLNLVVDTKHFNSDFKERLIASIDNLDEQTGGLMINSDNTHALSLLQNKYKNSVRCVYIDPPFNTGTDGFCYKDQYWHSSWCAMIYTNLMFAKSLMTTDATIYTHIDYYEKERLKLILDELFFYQTEIIWRIGWLSGYKTIAKKFIRNHDTIYQYSKSELPLFNKKYIPYPDDYVRRDGKKPDGEGYPIEDTWNCYELDRLDSIQIVSFSKEKVGDATATQKPEALLERIIIASSNPDDIILDFFGGTGTTMASAYKTNRKFISIEMSQHQFFDNEVPRIKRVLFGDRYGISSKYGYPKSGIVKYMKLESYEDALSNITLDDEKHGLASLFGDDYLINYMLDIEAEGSLLNLDAFRTPFEYKLKVTENNETKEKNVDVVETFNYLIGLTVQTASAITYFNAVKDENGEYEGAVRLIKDIGGTYGFKQIEGTTPDGKRVLVIWRTISDNLIESNAALDAYFSKHRINPQDREYDIIYVNGDNNLQNISTAEDTFKVQMTELEFKKRMFEEE